MEEYRAKQAARTEKEGATNQQHQSQIQVGSRTKQLRGIQKNRHVYRENVSSCQPNHASLSNVSRLQDPTGVAVLSTMKQLRGLQKNKRLPTNNIRHEETHHLLTGIPGQSTRRGLAKSRPYHHQSNISSNALNGTLPTELGLLTDAKGIDLSDLPFVTGTIPSELGLLTDLRYFNVIGSHKLSGTMPESLCSLRDSVCSFYRNCSLNSDCSAILCGCDCTCSNP